MQLIGRSGKHVIINHDNQTIIVDLEEAMSHYNDGKAQIGASYHQDYKVTEPTRILRDSCTGAIVMRLLTEVITEATKVE